MLKLYDYLENIAAERNGRQWYIESRLSYFLTDIMKALEIDNANEINAALNRVFHACATLRIPFSGNFKRVYRHAEGRIISDWKLSPLACYLVIINCDPNYENVAKAQIYFAIQQPPVINNG